MSWFDRMKAYDLHACCKACHAVYLYDSIADHAMCPRCHSTDGQETDYRCTPADMAACRLCKSTDVSCFVIRNYECNGWYAVRCNACGYTSNPYPTWERAVTVWNRSTNGQEEKRQE